MSIAEQLKQEGWKEGWKEGWRIGWREGRPKRSQEDVLEVLELRFHSVPPGLADAIRSIRDDSELRRLHRAAIQAVDIEAFTRSISSKRTAPLSKELRTENR